MFEKKFSTKCLSVEEVRALQGGPQYGKMVYVGDASDARCCSRLVTRKIVHNWPSQRRWLYPEGYIEFDEGIPFARNGRRLYLHSRTVSDTRVFLFRDSSFIRRRGSRCNLETKLMERVKSMCRGEDLWAIDDMINEILGRTRQSRNFLRVDGLKESILTNLSSLGVPHLRDLIELIDVPDPTCAPSEAESSVRVTPQVGIRCRSGAQKSIR